MRWWPEPPAGEIVRCHFPDNIHPEPKPRPVLIVSTKEDDEGMIFVSVAYGTSQKTDRPLPETAFLHIAPPGLAQFRVRWGELQRLPFVICESS